MHSSISSFRHSFWTRFHRLCYIYFRLLGYIVKIEALIVFIFAFLHQIKRRVEIAVFLEQVLRRVINAQITFLNAFILKIWTFTFRQNNFICDYLFRIKNLKLLTSNGWLASIPDNNKIFIIFFELLHGSISIR
jgi:hypothetical protein